MKLNIWTCFIGLQYYTAYRLQSVGRQVRFSREAAQLLNWTRNCRCKHNHGRRARTEFSVAVCFVVFMFAHFDVVLDSSLHTTRIQVHIIIFISDSDSDWVDSATSLLWNIDSRTQCSNYGGPGPRTSGSAPDLPL